MSVKICSWRGRAFTEPMREAICVLRKAKSSRVPSSVLAERAFGRKVTFFPNTGLFAASCIITSGKSCATDEGASRDDGDFAPSTDRARDTACLNRRSPLPTELARREDRAVHDWKIRLQHSGVVDHGGYKFCSSKLLEAFPIIYSSRLGDWLVGPLCPANY